MGEKCPFEYDGCMCSIPEDGEHCPEAFSFPDGKGGMTKCPYSPEARDIVEAVLDGRYTAAEVVTFEGHTYQLLRVDFDASCQRCGGSGEVPTKALYRYVEGRTVYTVVCPDCQERKQ